MTDLPLNVRDRLDREEIAWLCTLRSNGSPHLAPVWFLFRDGTWWVVRAAGNKKVRNAAADARVSLALESGTAPVVAEGNAMLHRDGFPQDVVSGFAAKYRGWDIAAAEGEGPLVLLEIPVTRWLLAGVAQ